MGTCCPIGEQLHNPVTAEEGARKQINGKWRHGADMRRKVLHFTAYRGLCATSSLQDCVRGHCCCNNVLKRGLLLRVALNWARKPVAALAGAHW